MRLVEQKKQEKRQRLLDSAYACITERGLSGTAISEITRRAGVAKGTFYLYFKDKEDIARALNERITMELLEESFAFADGHPCPSFPETLVTMAEYMIGRFEKDPELIRVIKHDFSWPVSKKDLECPDAHKRIPGLDHVRAFAEASNRPVTEVLSVLYCLICMVVSVSYDAIIEESPAPIEEMKPVLSRIIRTQFS